MLYTALQAVMQYDPTGRLERIQGRFAHPHAEPDVSIYHAIVDLITRTPQHVRTLLPYRKFFRAAVRQRPIAGLMYCLYDTDPRIQQYAIFLLGLCKRRGIEPDLVKMYPSPHRAVRKRIIMTALRIPRSDCRAWKRPSAC